MMIKNKRQYRITKTQAEKFEEALVHMERGGEPGDLHLLLHKAQVDAMRSQRDSLQQELAEYEALRDGVHVGEPGADTGRHPCARRHRQGRSVSRQVETSASGPNDESECAGFCKAVKMAVLV